MLSPSAKRGKACTVYTAADRSNTRAHYEETTFRPNQITPYQWSLECDNQNSTRVNGVTVHSTSVNTFPAKYTYNAYNRQSASCVSRRFELHLWYGCSKVSASAYMQCVFTLILLEFTSQFKGNYTITQRLPQICLMCCRNTWVCHMIDKLAWTACMARFLSYHSWFPRLGIQLL